MGEFAKDTGQSSATGVTNSFHVPMKRSPEGMGRGNRRAVAAVYAASWRVMNSDTCRNPHLGALKSISNAINSGVENRTEAHSLKASICLSQLTGS